MTTEKNVLETILSSFVDDNTGKTLASSIKNITIDDDGETNITLELQYPIKSLGESLKEKLLKHIKQHTDLQTIQINLQQRLNFSTNRNDSQKIKGVHHIIAISSAKGGVGKSTTAANLAITLSKEGARVGLLDADIYGPSIPMIFGASSQPETTDGKTIEPIEAHGIQLMSIGFLVDNDQPMVWRGPMATHALTQLLKDTQWKDIDYLIIDMPPGTGDIQLTLAQQTPVTAAVIVTTPQELAVIDARKGIKMFEKVKVPVLGVIENMSTHVCDRCGHEEAIFGSAGAEKLASDYQLSLLGKLPLQKLIREKSDHGNPITLTDPDSRASRIYQKIAQRIVCQIATLASRQKTVFPKIIVENT